MAINPATGYVAGTAADKAAMRGSIPKKRTTPGIDTTTGRPSTTVTGGVPVVAPTRTTPQPMMSNVDKAMQAGAARVNARIQARQTPGRTQTFQSTAPGIDPTTGKPSSTITGGVPTTFTPKTTVNKGIATTPMGISRTEDLGVKGQTVTEIGGRSSFATDPMKEKLTIRLEMGDPTLTEDDLATARDYLTEKMVFQRQQDPTAGVSKAYDRIQEQYQQQIQEQERLRQQKEQQMAVSRDERVQDFMGNLNTIYEPEIQLAREQGEVQKESVRSILSFSGFGRSTKTVEKLTEVDQNVDQRMRAIESQKQAEAMRYQAQLEGADAETLMAMDQNIMTLRNNANQLKLDSLVKIEELKLEAQQKGDEMAMKQLQNLQTNFLQDLNAYDEEESRRQGILIGMDGQPIFDESGKIQALPKNYDFGSPISDASGNVSIPVFDEASGTFKMVPTGIRERVPGSGGGGSGGTSTTPDLVKALYGDIKAGNVTYEEIKNIYGQKYVDDIRLYQASLGKRPTKSTISKPKAADPLADIAKALEDALK